MARNERIMSLEALLQDSQEKLTATNHRYVIIVSYDCMISAKIGIIRFEAQISVVKERLEAAKLGSNRGLSTSSTASGGFSFGGAGSRIAKPLRGGGGGEHLNGGPNLPVLNGLQAQEVNGGSGKRSSWFFDRR